MASDPISLRRYTALVRTVDPSRASNRFVLFATLVTFAASLITHLVGDTGTGAAFGSAVRDGATVFLAWALGRELDPDRTRTARYAAFGAAALLLVTNPDVAALVALLAAVRIVLRPTGLGPTVYDLTGLVVLAWFAGGDPSGIVASFGMAAALVWDTRLPVRAPRSSGLAGALVLSTAVVSAVLGGALFGEWQAPGLVEMLVFLIAMAASTQLPVPQVRSRADTTGEVLHVERLLRARVLTGVVLAGTLVWVGGPGIGALASGWAAFIATGVVRWTIDRRRRAAAEREVEARTEG